jgi:ATP-dependent RNA helicase DeaD
MDSPTSGGGVAASAAPSSASRPSGPSAPVESAAPAESAATAEDDLDAAPCGLGPVLRRRGFDQLTSIQRAVLDPEVAEGDLRIHSQTGSGKTVALGFVLAPELEDPASWGRAPRERPARSGAGTPAALIVAPTRELASQLGRELSWLLEPMGAKVAVVTGGASMTGEQRELAARPAVVAGTPGRLLDHLRRGTLKLDRVSSLVLDEADELLDMGFEEELDAILQFAPEERRTHLVSATFRRDVTAVADRMQKHPQMVRAFGAGKANTDIEHVGVIVPPQARTDAIINYLLRYPKDKTLVFVRTRADVQELTVALSEAGFGAEALSGELTHRKREETFEAFRSGRVRVLVATDVAARGLHVDDIARVIQAELPSNPDVFTHRSGRTGRAGRGGQNVTLVPPHARRRFDALLKGAKVRARFEPVPDRDAILGAADARLAEALAQDAGSPPERLRALAERLLEGAEPAEVVAQLLARSTHAGPCPPRHVPAPQLKKNKGDRGSARAGSDARREPRSGPKRGDSRGQADAPRSQGRGSRSRPEHPSSSTERSASTERSGSARRRSGETFVTYQVSWGAHAGADPRRLLALVCRRAGLGRNDIGAIRIAPKSSTVEIARPAVPKFEQAIRRKDERDPHVRFRPWQPRQSGAQSR